MIGSRAQIGSWLQSRRKKTFKLNLHCSWVSESGELDEIQSKLITKKSCCLFRVWIWMWGDTMYDRIWCSWRRAHVALCQHINRRIWHNVIFFLPDGWKNVKMRFRSSYTLIFWTEVNPQRRWTYACTCILLMNCIFHMIKSFSALIIIPHCSLKLIAQSEHFNPLDRRKNTVKSQQTLHNFTSLSRELLSRVETPRENASWRRPSRIIMKWAEQKWRQSEGDRREDDGQYEDLLKWPFSPSPNIPPSFRRVMGRAHSIYLRKMMSIPETIWN